MGNDKFEKIAKKLVVEYANEHIDKSDGVKIGEENVFIVWICKTLQNNKALLSTTLFDGMYYEITYNGDTGEIYFDAYKKWENIRYYNAEKLIRKGRKDEKETCNDGSSTSDDAGA